MVANQMVAARHPYLGVSEGELLAAAEMGSEWPHELVLRIRGAGLASVRGWVLDDRGRPVRDAWVQVQPRGSLQFGGDGSTRTPPAPELCRTDQGGAFAAAWLPPGQHELYVYKRGFAPHRRQLELAAREPLSFTVELRPGATLRGTVRDGAGQAVAGAAVRAPALQFPQQSWLTIGPDAAFTFEDLPPGELEVVASHPQLSSVAHRLAIAGDETHTWECVLTAERLVNGRLLDHMGEPLAGWFVQRPYGGRFASTDAEGRFVCTECDAAANTLLVRPGLGYVPVRARFEEVLPGPHEQTFAVPAESAPSAHLRGRCLAADGSPLAGAILNLHQEDLFVHNQTTTRDDGSFAIGPLPPGKYRVIPTHAAARFDPADTELLPQATVELPPLRAR
jgi:hypothetical protein